MKALQQLENVFTVFGRLNTILNDNWKDSNSESFNNDVIVPIVTEFSMFHSSAQDMLQRIHKIHQEIDEGIYQLQNEINESYIPGDCRLNGYHVFRTYFHQYQYSECRPFLVSPDELISLDGDQSEFDFFASGKFPAAEDCHDTYIEERISIQ